MRKICVSIIAGLVAFSAFGVGENVPTSKSYIDSELSQKQDTIERTTGNNKALTNTGTAGEYGTKDIYDSTSSYAEQTDALIDAQTMNAAVQNAINAEFVCISWVDDDPTKDCLLMEIRSVTEHRSPNLFDISKITTRDVGDTLIVNNGDGSITVTASPRNSGITTQKKLSELAPEIIADETYTLSFDTTGNLKRIFLYCYGHSSDTTLWFINKSKVITDALLDCNVFFYASNGNLTATIKNIQITEGTTVQPYQPYGNIYIPAGN